MYHLGVLIPYNLLFNAKPEVRSPTPTRSPDPTPELLKGKAEQQGKC